MHLFLCCQRFGLCSIDPIRSETDPTCIRSDSIDASVGHASCGVPDRTATNKKKSGMGVVALAALPSSRAIHAGWPSSHRALLGAAIEVHAPESKNLLRCRPLRSRSSSKIGSQTPLQSKQTPLAGPTARTSSHPRQHSKVSKLLFLFPFSVDPTVRCGPLDIFFATRKRVGAALLASDK